MNSGIDFKDDGSWGLDVNKIAANMPGFAEISPDKAKDLISATSIAEYTKSMCARGYHNNEDYEKWGAEDDELPDMSLSEQVWRCSAMVINHVARLEAEAQRKKKELESLRAAAKEADIKLKERKAKAQAKIQKANIVEEWRSKKHQNDEGKKRIKDKVDQNKAALNLLKQKKNYCCGQQDANVTAGLYCDGEKSNCPCNCFVHL